MKEVVYLPAVRKSAKDADRVLSRILKERDISILRKRAEAIRQSRGPRSHLGANHYFQALVELGWSDVIAVGLAAELFASAPK
jgi:hypothetical protein